MDVDVGGHGPGMSLDDWMDAETERDRMRLLRRPPSSSCPLRPGRAPNRQRAKPLSAKKCPSDNPSNTPCRLNGRGQAHPGDAHPEAR
jgi:hypothetical protein